MRLMIAFAGATIQAVIKWCLLHRLFSAGEDEIWGMQCALLHSSLQHASRHEVAAHKLFAGGPLPW